MTSLILTHFSGRYQKQAAKEQNDIEQLRNEARKLFTGTIDLAEDMGCWELARNGDWRRIH